MMVLCVGWLCHFGSEEVQYTLFSLLLRHWPQVLSSMPGVEVVGLEQRDKHDASRSIDIVARYKGQLLALEVDGPQHFTWPGQRPTGDTLERNRALERRGYRVVSVPVNPGWDQQRRQQQQQQQRYLQGLLDGQPTSNNPAYTTVPSTAPARTTTTTTTTSSSSSSNSLAPPTLARVPSTGLAVPGAPGLLARPQRPRPAAGPVWPAKKKRQRS
jgi:hypothetical protein